MRAIISWSCLVTFFLFVSSVFSLQTEVQELDESNFESVAFGKPGVYSFVYFYSPNCKHCQALNPMFAPLGELYKDTKLQIFKVNGLDNKRIRREYNLVAFPVMKLFSSEGEQVGYFKSAKSTVDIINYLTDATGIQPNYPEPAVIPITPSNFDEVIFNDNEDTLKKDIVLVFYDPSNALWDNSYGSFYQRLALYYRDQVEDENIVFAGVDVSLPENKPLIDQFTVSKTPTLFHFYKGRPSEEWFFVLDETVGPEEIVGTLMNSDVNQKLYSLPQWRKEQIKKQKQDSNERDEL